MPRREGSNPLDGDWGYAGSFVRDWRLVVGLRKPGGARKFSPPKVGARFGKLRVEGYVLGGRGGLRAVAVSCACDRANTYGVAPDNLRKGRSTRCNRCAKQKSGDSGKRYWGYADILPDDTHRKRLLNRIASCIQRCGNPQTASFPYYGGRGIHVWPQWVADRKEFLRYLLTLPGWDVPRLDLDRIDVNRGYEPGNLRFVTRRDNSLNRRTVLALQAEVDRLRCLLRGAPQ